MSDILTFVERLPKLPTENPPLLILLHGYGSNELDLFSFANELPDSLVIISLRAPYEMGYGCYSWYDINLDSDNNKFSDLNQARKSLKKITTNIDYLKNKYFYKF